MEKSESKDIKLQKVSIIYEDQFSAVQLDEILGDDNTLDCYHIRSILHKAAETAENGGSNSTEALFLLSSIAAIHDRFDTPSEPYGAMLIMDGKRSMIPKDLIGEQTAELSKFVGKINNYPLKARVSDIAWLNDRKNHEMAKIAIDAYRVQVDMYLEGEAYFRQDLDTLIDHRAFDLIRRALTIERSIKGKNDYSKPIINVLDRVKALSFENCDIPSMTKLIGLFLDFSIYDTELIADDALKVFESQKDKDSHWSKHFLIEVERLFRRNKNSEKSNDCLLLIAECSVQRAEQMSNSSMVSANWIMKAIEELKLARGTKARDRYRELKKLLREKQEESIFELQSFSHSVDIGDLVKMNIERQKKLTLGQALGEFASLVISEDREKLKESAIESIKAHPLSSMFGGSRLDKEGKVIEKTESSGFGDASDDDAILTSIAEDLKHKRNVVVSSGIEPVRRFIQVEHGLTDEALNMICENSSFIPPNHESIFLLGFQKFFQGDMASAGSILIPQMENSLRYILKTADVDTSTIESDSTQVDRSISQLMGLFRNDLVKILGEAMVFEIDLLFNSRKGPALRHEIAHGKYSEGQFYSNDVVYACWFVFRVTCMPLFPYWEELSKKIDEYSR